MMCRRGLETEVQVKSMLRVPFIFACCLTIVSCAAKTDRNAPVTILDFRTQNVERLHSGIERLVGEDSAGVAAMEYIQNYENDLVKYYPIRNDPTAPAESNPTNNGLDCSYMTIIVSKFPETNPINPDPQTRRFLDYLKGRRLGAMTDLQKYRDEYILTGNVTNAKMGLVNAYVAVTAMPSPNEMKNIVDLVEPLLAGLTLK